MPAGPAATQVVRDAAGAGRTLRLVRCGLALRQPPLPQRRLELGERQLALAARLRRAIAVAVLEAVEHLTHGGVGVADEVASLRVVTGCEIVLDVRKVAGRERVRVDGVLHADMMFMGMCTCSHGPLSMLQVAIVDC